jgi:ribosomal protein L11 methyltransferase
VTKRLLWKLSLVTTIKAEEAVTDLLGEIFGRYPSSYTNASTSRTTVTVYLERKPARDCFELRNLRIGLKLIKEALPDMRNCKITLSKLRRQDWANSWKRHFKPIEVGSALLIRPSWSKRRPRSDQALVQIDPGLAFGTGQHPTTEFCLQELVSRRDPHKHQSFLDLGTGSGILAITAAKLGYGPIDAIDLDPAAIQVSRANALQNRVEHAIRFHQQDLATLSSQGATQYDLICANLIANVLIAECQRILARLKPKGFLVLSGILTREFSEIKKHYKDIGLKLISSATSKEWRSGSFSLASP